MSSLPPGAQEALDFARQGDIGRALQAARKAVASNPDDYGLRLFIGALHSRRLELDDALPHVRKAVELAPRDPIARVELVRLLIGLGKLDEAEQQLSQASIPGLEPNRLLAMIHARRDQPGLAARIFRQVVAADPRDYESWGSLGACLLALGQPALAIEPFSRALQLRPDLQKFREKLMEAQVAAGKGGEALVAARQEAIRGPRNIAAAVTVARLEDLLGLHEQAVETLRSGLTRQPDHLPALIALAGLLERQNSIDEFAEAIARIERLDPKAIELPLLRARLALRRQDFAQALELVESTPEAIDRGTRSELLGKIRDRLGDSEAAFRSFEEMNGETDLSERVIARQSQALRDMIDRRAQITTPEWVRGWSAQNVQPGRREPAFVLGFARSGTTLLDTFLMGHPDVCVADEKPLLQAVSARLGEYERIAALDPAEIHSLQDCYFQAAAEHVPNLGDRLLIDKFPLGAIDTGLIHRLFPTARIVFAQRHPCDVVLSCFMTRFQPSPTLTSFCKLEDAARLYDRLMSFWEGCRAAMPLNVHVVRYEAFVDNAEDQMRQLLAFLGLEWDDRVLDHQRIAGSRKFIGTASYTQVVQPLYDRSVGRWTRYREQMASVLPILEPWAVKMGYSV